MRPTGHTLYYVCFILLLSGSTYAQVFPVQGKMFNGASVEVAFQGAINANYQLITGEVESTYKKDSKMGLVVEEMHKIGENKKSTPEARIDTTGIEPIAFPGTIDSVYFDQDKKEVVVVDTEGKKTSYPQKTDPKTKEAKPIQITDAAGNTVTVGKDGMVTKGSGGSSGSSEGKALVNKKIGRMILVSLNKFKKEIEDYQGEQKQVPPKSKGGPHWAEWETEMIMTDLPKCLKKHKDKLNEIKNNIISLLDSTSTAFKDFAVKVEKKMGGGDKTTQGKVDEIVCEVLVEELDTVTAETITTELKSNGTVINKGAYVLISAEPAMPTLSVKAKSNIADSKTEVSFRLKIEYRRDIRQDEDFFPAGEAMKIKANKNWDIDFGDQVRGGRATLYCDYGTAKDTIIFYIRGTNPTEQAVKDYINLQSYNVWFFTRLVRQESGYLHFKPGTKYGTGWDNDQGCPRWGAPHGWGLTQLDFLDRGQRPTAQELWNWKANIDRGYQFLNGEKRRTVNNNLNSSVAVINSWYKKNKDDTIKGHTDQVEGSITYTHANSPSFDFDFGIEVTGQNKSFADAAWIKNYNGHSGGTDGYPGHYYVLKQIKYAKPFWAVQRTNSLGRNYVEDVSNRDE